MKIFIATILISLSFYCNAQEASIDKIGVYTAESTVIECFKYEITNNSGSNILLWIEPTDFNKDKETDPLFYFKKRQTVSLSEI